MAKYTFLLPAFKARFLVAMLNSIRKQTFKDFRVIISDDCSPEDIKSVCTSYLEDPRFVYRRNEENMGGRSLVSHWNKLIDLCNTEYLIMASDDDIYDHSFLEKVDALVTKYPTVDLFRTRAQIIDEEEEIVRIDQLNPEYVRQLEFMLQYEQPTHVTCVGNYVYKTAALRNAGGFVEYPLAWKSDTMTANILAKNGVANTSEVLFNFRVSGQNISSDESQEVLQKKYQATYLKDLDMSDLLSRLNASDLSKLQRNLLSAVQEKHIERTISELDMFAVALPFSGLLEAVRFFNKKHYFKSKFQIVLLIKKWFYYHSHH